MRACCAIVRAALAVVVLCCCVCVARAQRLPPVSAVMQAGYAPNLLPPAGETGFFSAYTDPPKPPEAVACGWNEGAGEVFDEFGTWWDNTLVSIGAESYRTVGDQFSRFGPASYDGNSAGAVALLNSAFQFVEGSPIRGQFGISYGVYDFRGRATNSPNAEEVEQQLFTTIGMSKRGDVLGGDRWSWGLVWDHLQVSKWGYLGTNGGTNQVRSLAGWAIDTRNEIGFWGAFRGGQDLTMTRLSQRVNLHTTDQYNLFWRHNYDFGGQTMIWVGGADPSSVTSWLVGALGEAPINNNLAIYGNFAFALPSRRAISGSAEEEWAVAVGLTYFFGAKAVRPTVSGRQGLPLIPVANNGTMLITY